MARLNLLGVIKGVVLSAIISTLLITTCFAYEDVILNQLWIVDDFSGGLDTKTSTIKLDNRTGDICENIRFNEDRKSIVKRNDILSGGTASATEAITGMHRLYLSDGTKVLIVNHDDDIDTRNDSTNVFTVIETVSSGGYKWKWITWHDLAIGMDGYNQPIKYDGSSASSTYLGSCLATDATTGSGPTGTYTYKVTFYTTTYEIGLNQASNSITVTDNDIDLTEIPIGPSTYFGEDVIGRKIYRTLTGGSIYKIIENGTIADNTTVILTDTTADADLGATLSTDLDEAPPKGKLSIIHGDRLFVANNPTNPSRLYYSDIGNHDYFPIDNYEDIRNNDGNEITLMEVFQGILYIGKNNSMQAYYTNPDDVSYYAGDPFNFKGCQAVHSAATSVHGIIYLAMDGLYLFNGQYSKLLSDLIEPTIMDISENQFEDVWGIVHGNKYYLTYASEATGSQTNNRVLVYEIPSRTFSIDIMDINCFCLFNAGTDNDVLYLGSSLTGAIYSASEPAHEIIFKRHGDFDGGTWDDARYIPTGVPGGDKNSPIIEIARIETIDNLSGTIDNLSGIIDREDTGGTFISNSIQTNMNSFDKLYWNEIIPASGGDTTIAIRTDADDSAWGAWSSEYTDPTGSDISALTAREYLQFRITLTATNINYSPNVYLNKNCVVRITYNTEGSVSESGIPARWRSGWNSLEAPAREKTLRTIRVYHEGESGDLNITFENYNGETDLFEIDLAENKSYYETTFSDGGFSGKEFRILIENNDLIPLTIDRIIVVYDVRPIT